MRAFIFLFLFFGFSFSSYAEKLSSDQEKALAEVVDQLRDPQKRKEAVGNDSKAKQADEFLKQLGGAQSEEIYQLAAEILQGLVVEANGDANKMEQLLEKAKKDPASFGNKLTAEQKKHLQQIAEKIGKTKRVP